jgi:dihydroorotase
VQGVLGALDYDVVITGGRLFDGIADIGAADIAVSRGCIVAIDRELNTDRAATILDAQGLLVTPGLIDLHTHVFAGQDLGVATSLYGPLSGTTTFVDAGSAGAHLFEAFRHGYIDPAAERVLAYLNISTIGTTSVLLAGECENNKYCEPEACVTCFDQNRDVLVGIKVRASGNVVGRNGIGPLRLARETADRLGTHLMVHIGPPPPEMSDILALLATGDVLTHCFTGFDNRVIDADARPRPDVVAARDRGVLFDVGHGASAFNSDVAAAMIAGGFLPDTISTDLHNYSSAAVENFPAVLSKFLALGIDIEGVLRLATSAPAEVLQRPELGYLRVGGQADIAVFDLLRGAFMFSDTWGHEFSGRHRLVCRATVRDGVIVYNQLGNRHQPDATE